MKSSGQQAGNGPCAGAVTFLGVKDDRRDDVLQQDSTSPCSSERSALATARHSKLTARTLETCTARHFSQTETLAQATASGPRVGIMITVEKYTASKPYREAAGLQARWSSTYASPREAHVSCCRKPMRTRMKAE